MVKILENRWAIAALVFTALGPIGEVICKAVRINEYGECVLLLALFATVGCILSVVAAVRGSRWWFVLSIVAAYLAAVGIIASLAGD
jgi:membrane protein YqaA with SNARE-associated domain